LIGDGAYEEVARNLGELTKRLVELGIVGDYVCKYLKMGYM
jgi:hypothetical protein